MIQNLLEHCISWVFKYDVFLCTNTIRLCTNPSGYKLGCHRSHSMLHSKAVFEEIFNGPTAVFVASLVPELFTRFWRILNMNRL